MSEEQSTVITEIRNLTDSAFVLQMDRNGIEFLPGQHIGLGLKDYPYMRDYSILSGVNDPYLEVLIREVPEGNLSKRLKKLKVGQTVKYDGPHGSFGVNRKDLATKKFILVASGTGIAPFHSFVRSYPEMNYTLIHGVRFGNEAYERDEFKNGQHILCTSQDTKGDFNGRVTDYLRIYPKGSECLYYLCGNGDMVFDVNDILLEQGVPSDQIFFEVYF